MEKQTMGKKLLCIVISLMLAAESFAAVVSDNDGSAFVTKQEFESLKEDFSKQIDNYNISIDNKIDGAIASYLAGIKLSKKTSFEPFYPIRLNKSTGKLTNIVYSINKQSFDKKKQYKNQFNVFATKWNGAGYWGSSVTSLKPYTHTTPNNRAWYIATINIQHKFNSSDKQIVFVTSKDNPTWVKKKYDLGYLNISGGLSYIQLWLGAQQVWWINTSLFTDKKLQETISEYSLQGINSNTYDDSSKTIQLGLIQQDTRYDISSGNSLKYSSSMYYATPGIALVVTKAEKNVDDNIYLYNVVDDKIVMYNEEDKYLEEYTETAYTTSDKLTVRQEVVYNGAGTRQASGKAIASGSSQYGWYVDTAWPRVRIQQRQNGKDASGKYIRYDNLNQLKNGSLQYEDAETGEMSAPGFAGGLPLFSMNKAAKVEFSIKVVNDKKSGLEDLTKARVYVSKGEFLNKRIGDYTDSEKASLVKFGKENYIDINIGEEKVISINEVDKNKTYFLRFGDPDKEYGGKIELLDYFYYTYLD